MSRLLLIDDDTRLTEQLSSLFDPPNEIAVTRSGQEALRQMGKQLPDVVLLDIDLRHSSGLELCDNLRRLDARIPVIFVTATLTTDTAIEAMRKGAHDILFKPVDAGLLRESVSEALEFSHRVRGRAAADLVEIDQANGDALIGRCPAMREVYKAIGRVADQNLVVLITGESGTGKELIASAICRHSGRSKAPFLAMNCAAIPDNLLESELFGHEKGAFTGAEQRRIGKFEQCNGGTLLLDEIGDMPMATQGKILRLLQDQKFERVGGNETIHTDVRLIAATNRDLKAWAEAGKFRSDLYFRLSVYTIHLPPLRERGEDLLLLVQYYVRRISRELRRDIHQIAPATIEKLAAYSWPGNVRELQSVLKRALLLAEGTVLTPEFLPDLSAPESGRKSTASQFDLDAFMLERLSETATGLYEDAHVELDQSGAVVRNLQTNPSKKITRIGFEHSEID
jgi:two-component system response regulator AtoC